ncbi:MAG: hypothetical protein JO002_11170 [Burkholderiaceae bacterium]|nr:hypothetical protein [Burkholderiaceae bacterium]
MREIWLGASYGDVPNLEMIMAASPFDTLKMAERLQEAGVPVEQAKMHAVVLAEALTEASYTDRFASEPKVSAEFALVKIALEKLDAKIDKVDAKIDKTAAELRTEMIRWMVTLGIVQTGLISGLFLKLLH